MQCVAYVVSDEGSISRFATSIPDLLDKAKLDLGKKLDGLAVFGFN